MKPLAKAYKTLEMMVTQQARSTHFFGYIFVFRVFVLALHSVHSFGQKGKNKINACRCHALTKKPISSTEIGFLVVSIYSLLTRVECRIFELPTFVGLNGCGAF